MLDLFIKAENMT